MKKVIFIVFLCFVRLSSANAQPQFGTVFFDDFSDGIADGWDLNDGWQVELDDNDFVLSGEGHNWATPEVQGWTDFIVEARIKLIQGYYHFNIRLAGENRYFFPVHPTFVQLFKNGDQLTETNYNFDLNEWFLIRIEAIGDSLRFFVNDNLILEYQDNIEPIAFGRFAFECGDDSHMHVDDVKVTAEVVFQEAKWIKTGGPFGGQGYDMRVDPANPDIVYTTDNWAGMQKSVDGGETWFEINDGIITRTGPSGDAIPVFSMTIDPNDPSTLWCGTQGIRGIYKSTNSGQSWVKKDNGVPEFEYGITFRHFTVDFKNSNIVYASCGVPTGEHNVERGKIYKTIDGGENWFEILDSDALLKNVLIHSNDSNILYAATGIFDRDDVQEEGIFKSTDGGQNWIRINTGITNMTVGSIDLRRDQPDVLFAATGRHDGFGGAPDAKFGKVYRSINGGESWQTVVEKNIGEYFPVTEVAVSPSHPDIIVAEASSHELVKSTDGGDTWTFIRLDQFGFYPGLVIDIQFHPTNPDIIFYNSYNGGVFRSLDGGFTWAPSSKGYTGAQTQDVSVCPGNPLIVYAVGRAGIFRTTDGGSNWKSINFIYDGNHFIGAQSELVSVAVHPQNHDVALAGNRLNSELLRTTDGGQRWNSIFPVGIPQERHSLTEIAYSLSHPDTVYIVYQKEDLSSGSFGVLKSQDGGINWKSKNSGLGTDLNVNTIAVHPDDDTILFIGMVNYGVFKSINGGDSWMPASNGLVADDIRAIAIDPNQTNTIYAGAEHGGIYISTDSGENWQKISIGMDPEASIRSIVIDPTNSDVVYAHDWLTGVYRTTDGGQKWHAFNDRLSTRAGQSLAISSDGRILYAGTEGEGVFRLMFDQLPPKITAVSPDTSQPVEIAQGDSLEFSISAHDLNDDIIEYKWFLDGQLLPNSNSSHILFQTENLQVGDYELTATVSDSFATKTISWQVQVTFPTSVDTDLTSIPEGFQLFQNYPNPFNPTTTIKFAVKAPSRVVLKVYDILGRTVKTLVNKKYPVGFHELEFDASDLASGVYFYEIKMADFIDVKKALFLK